MKNGYNGVAGQLGGSKVKLCLDWLIFHEWERKQTKQRRWKLK